MKGVNGTREDQVRAEEGARCQQHRLQSNSSGQSKRRGALAQMHKAGLTGLPQHYTREGLSPDITVWTTELILPHLPQWTGTARQTSSLPLTCPRDTQLSYFLMCLLPIPPLETFPLNMNSLNNKWKLSETASRKEKYVIQCL